MSIRSSFSRKWDKEEDNNERGQSSISGSSFDGKDYRQKHFSYKQTSFKKLKTYPSEKYNNFKHWLRKRNYNKYDYRLRFRYLITTILMFIVSISCVAIFYSNATKLNEINLWIINIGGVLVLTSFFFAIKFGWRIYKEFINILKRQKRWLRYLIIILFVLFLWRSYVHKDTILNPLSEIYNNINFDLLVPINLSDLNLEIISNSSQSISNTKLCFIN